MVAPDTDSLRFPKQVACLIDAISGKEDVTDDDNLIHLLITQPLQSDLQVVDVFVDVCDQTQFHGTNEIDG